VEKIVLRLVSENFDSGGVGQNQYLYVLPELWNRALRTWLCVILLQD